MPNEKENITQTELQNTIIDPIIMQQSEQRQPTKESKIDYANTIMYMIYCIDPAITAVYIGHTTNFDIRKSQHKSICNNTNYNSYKIKIYTTIRANGGWSNWKMVELEKYPCKSKKEAVMRELELYDKHNSVLNTRRPLVPDEEKSAGRKDCPCGGYITYPHGLRHYSSLRHLKYMMELNDKLAMDATQNLTYAVSMSNKANEIATLARNAYLDALAESDDEV